MVNFYSVFSLSFWSLTDCGHYEQSLYENNTFKMIHLGLIFS